MLEATRDQIVDWLTEHDQPWRHDQTNDDPAYTRNRIRLDLLPGLQRDFNPQVVDAICRLGAQAAEAQDALAAVALSVLQDATVQRTASMVRFLLSILF